MNKYKTGILGGMTIALSLLITILLLCSFVSAQAAHAAEDVAISYMAPLSVPYGEGSDELAVATVNYQRFEYAWYKSETLSGTALKVAERTSDDGQAYLSLTSVSDSGFYRFDVLSVTDENGRRAANVKSNTVYMEVTPKEAEVTVEETTLVYSGAWQSPKIDLKAEDIIEGDTVNVYLDAGKSTMNAGKYTAKIKFDNENYCVKGEDEISFEIKKAALTIKTKDLAVRTNQTYGFEIEYIGLKGNDKPEDLGFTPTIDPSAFEHKTSGNYSVYCSGKTETENYVISYPAGALYVAKGALDENEIVGVTATAGGAFRIGTVLTVTESKEKVKGLPFLGIVKYNYVLNFTQGASEGNTFALNIEDEKIMKFMLAVCYTDKDGGIHAVKNFSYKEGVLSVTLPSDIDGSLVIYNDFTLLVIVGGVLVLIILIMVIAIAKSRSTYRKKKYFLEQASALADDYRARHEHPENENPWD